MRHTSLDGWRGVGALFIAFFHLGVYGFPLFIHAYMFVDFFLLLSGYVIEGAYQSRLTDWHAGFTFLRKRFVRIYPVHLVVLAVMVVGTGLVLQLHWQRAAVFLHNNTLFTLVTNLLLLHGMGLHGALNWNFPSWTISSEFWVYVTYVIMKVGLPNRWLLPLSATIFAATLTFLALTSNHGIDLSYDFGYLRCLMDFLLGLLIRRLIGAPRLSIALASWAEAAMIVVVAALFWFGGWNHVDFLAPFVFAALVLVYAMDAGRIARLLSARPMQWLGVRSYAFYMTHMPVILLFQPSYDWLAEQPGMAFLAPAAMKSTFGVLIVVPIVTVLADLIYRFVEKPSHRLA